MTTKGKTLTLNLDLALSLMSIRDKLDKGSAEIHTNRVVKKLIIEIYDETVCFTYPSNKQMSHMILSNKSSPEALQIGRVPESITCPKGCK